MVNENFQKDLQQMIKDKLIFVDNEGEMQLTRKGMEQSEELLQKNKGSREYMKHVAKHFTENSPDKETVNIKDIADEIDLIDNTKIDIYERFGISENDDLKNYQLFCKILDMKKEDSNSLHDLTEKQKKGYFQMVDLFNTQYELFKDAKYFEVPENVNLLLSNTKNEIKKVKFPYYFLFIDVKLVVLDRIYYSFFVTDLRSFYQRYKKGMKDSTERVNILTFYEDEEGKLSYDNFDLYKKDRNKYRNKIREYLMNFVDFVNSEEVKLMFRERTEKNTERRIQRGKLPIPPFSKIYVIGYLKKYLNKLESQELQTRFTHRFWVRGHFKRFLDKKRYKKLYEQYRKGELKNFEGKKYKIDESFLKVWIFPYIKGEGMLIEKRYKLE